MYNNTYLCLTRAHIDRIVNIEKSTGFADIFPVGVWLPDPTHANNFLAYTPSSHAKNFLANAPRSQH